MTAGFIVSQRTGHGVPHSVSCRALGIPKSTFYKHLNRPPTAAQQRRAALDAEVRAAFDESEGTYGSPRVRARLRRDGISVSKKAVEASMARQGLCARPKHKKGLTSPDSSHAAPGDLLGRDFSTSSSAAGPGPPEPEPAVRSPYGPTPGTTSAACTPQSEWSPL